MASSPLTPVTITDKNGVVTVRHKKVAQQSATVRAIPSAPPITSPSQSAGMSNGEIIEMAKLRGIDMSGDLLDTMRDYDDGGSVDAASRYFQTGSETGRGMAFMSFCAAYSFLKEAHKDASSDEDWADNCPESFGAELESKVVASWAAGNVLEESGGVVAGKPMYAASLRYFNRHLYANDPRYYSHYCDNTDPAHWRGIAMLCLADNEEKASESDQRNFATWVAERDDLALVLRTAKERGTVNVETLSAIIEQDVAVPLQHGAL